MAKNQKSHLGHVQVVLSKYVVDFDNDQEYKVTPPTDDNARAMIVEKLGENPTGKVLS